MDIRKILQQLEPADIKAYQAAQKHWDHICKPLNSLGQLEILIDRIAAIQGQEEVQIQRKAVLTFCADNGVVGRGISQSDQSVTTSCADSLLHQRASVSCMARACGADAYVIDVGMADPVVGLINRSVARGTQDIYQGPAMSKDQAWQALQAGFDSVAQASDQSYQVLAQGEMGIGNTTTSAAVASVLLGLPVEKVTGRGAGLSDQGLATKIRVIQHAVQVNQPDPTDPIDVLAKLGGFDIGAMAGACIGAAYYHIPMVIDGLISAISALLACRLNPHVLAYLLPSHQTAETAGPLLMQELGFQPILHADMRLGEGTGAVCLFPLLDLALAVYQQAASFDDNAMEAYTKLS